MSSVSNTEVSVRSEVPQSSSRAKSLERAARVYAEWRANPSVFGAAKDQASQGTSEGMAA